MGAQHLANALRNNTVTLFLSYSSSFHHIHFFTQTLTTLDLSRNQIRPAGAQHLADALQNNTVTLYPCYSSSFHHIRFSHRHSPHYISETIKSDMSEHNIWPMHYEITQWPSFSLIPAHFAISTCSYRRSPHWILHKMKSDLWEHTIWLMHYDITQWPSSSLILPHFTISTFSNRHLLH